MVPAESPVAGQHCNDVLMLKSEVAVIAGTRLGVDVAGSGLSRFMSQMSYSEPRLPATAIVSTEPQVLCSASAAWGRSDKDVAKKSGRSSSWRSTTSHRAAAARSAMTTSTRVMKPPGY
jgi:hypothetical protein